MKKIVILGSTGSIGQSALEVIRTYPEEFKVVGLSAKNNYKLLKEQAEEFKVKNIGIENEVHYSILRKSLPSVKIWTGKDSYTVLTGLPEADLVLSAIVGIEGLLPTWHAINSYKNVALANKESLVVAGDILMSFAKKKKVKIIPVDSEHNAIWSILSFVPKEKLKKIILTASGGPFFKKSISSLKKVTIKEALNHPTWNMGAKITVDCATMINKGFEVIEAHHLFGVPYDNIEVIIHPESVIHSLVQTKDGSYYAKLGQRDMKFPILSALSEGKIVESRFPTLDLKNLSGLNFFQPDLRKFPLLKLSYEVGKKGGIFPAIFAAADELAVKNFLKGKISFVEIYRFIEKRLKKAEDLNIPSDITITDIFEITKDIISSG